VGSKYWPILVYISNIITASEVPGAILTL